MPTMQPKDWSDCPLVEVVPGKVSGAPVLKGTRLPAQAILDNRAHGLSVAEIAEQFDVPEDRVRAILDYAVQAKRKRRRGLGPA
jgi:uncharacterized protein (DUF433 family)